MIKTLKSELTLRPTYDELIGLINKQGDENRPPIENIRNNQFGSQFDNVDFLGSKKQEEDKVKEELRQTQLRQTAMATGSRSSRASSEASSMGILSYGGRTPVGAYNADGFETPDSDYRMTAEQTNRIRAELELGARRQQEAHQASSSSSSARSDLSEATSQSLPAGVPIHSMVTDDEQELPPLETPTEVAEEEEEDASEKSSRGIRDEDDDETQVPPQSRKHKETKYCTENIDRWRQKDISVDDILFQLHLRGIKLTEEEQEEMSKFKIKGKGKTPTQKDYLLTYVERLVVTGKWANEVNDQLLQSRMEDWRQMKKGKGKGVIRKAFESAGSSLLEAGKEAVKGAVIEGAKSAVMSLL